MPQCSMTAGRLDRPATAKAMPDDLRITLLGPLTLARGGRALPESIWRSRQERRLLCILITARGARVPAERLVEWLWPAADRATAAISLRSAISSLRHTLEPGGEARASAHYILTRPGGYTWNRSSRVWVDVEAFLALTMADRQAPIPNAGKATGDHPTSTPARAARIQELQEAISLYRGDYLEDEPEAPWAAPMRELLRERLLIALFDLAELRIAAGEHRAAIALARRGLDIDPLREPLYRTLMRAQAHMGDVAGALQSFERYRLTLDEELGAEPSAQTRELHAAILRGEAVWQTRDERPETRDPRRETRDERPETGSRLMSHVSRLTSPGLSVSSSPFVGREQELLALQGWIADLDRRRGGIVAIVGEAGIGKTRLVSEALRAAAERGTSIIALRCALLEHGLPFAPLSEALRPLLRAAPAEVLGQLPLAALAQVADLLPALRERLPDLPTVTVPPPIESYNHLIDGMVDLALALARTGPLVVWCDDAQWADEATLAVLGRLARHAARHALLLILAYRSEELVENAALHGLLRSLGREMLLRPLLLSRFDAAEIAQFLAGLAQSSPERVAHLAPRLAASSAGNPLFLSVAVQSLLETHGAPSLAALLPTLEADAPMPDLAGAPPLRDLVLARLERLSMPARALAEQLAVIGRPVSLDLIEQIGGAPALEAARALLERQLLVEGADERLGFGHELVRSIVATALSSPQRRLLHRRAAEAIAALHGDQPQRAAELVFHFARAGHDAEAEVLRYATAAGDHARRAFAYREALGHYDAALRAIERMGQRAPAATVRRAFSGRLLTYEALLDWDGILATSARYAGWAAQQPGAPPLVAPRRLVLLRALMGDLAGAAALSIEQMPRRHETAPAIDDMLWRTAIILQPVEQVPSAEGRVTRDEPSNARHWAPDTRHLTRFTPAHPLPGAPADDLPALLGPDEAALALFQVGWAALMQGLLDDAEPCILRAFALAVETSQAAVAVVSALQLAHLNALRGDRPASERWLTTSLDLAQQAPDAAWATIWPRIHQAFLLLTDDQYATAREHLELMAARLHELPAFQSHRASVEAGLGLIDLAGGDLAQASVRLTSALASPQLLYGFVYVAAQHGLARIAALGGDMQAARATLLHTLDYSARRSLLPEYVRTAIEIGRIERDFGEPALTLPLLREAAGLARAAGLEPLASAATALLTRLLG